MKFALPLTLALISINSFAQIGLTLNSDEAFEGYTLFHPNSSTSTFLIDNSGNLVNEWRGSNPPGRSVYLLENGLLLRTADVGNANFSAGGRGGRIELVDWEGNITWGYNFSDFDECHHHDVQMLPNGNILAILWERYTQQEAVDAGRDPSTVDDYLWSEKIIEFTPIGSGSVDIVWEWRVWDHLVQDFDASKANFGVVSEEVGKIDINANRGAEFDPTDWLHINAIDYNEELDQFILSSPFLNEIWVIDHSTTTSEAAGNMGGNSGMGGRILYRWGNPQNYDRGTNDDRILFGQHNPEWIETTTGWQVSIFNNGNGRETPYSSIDIIDLPLISNTYTIDAIEPFLPLLPSRTYTASTNTDFYSRIISGAQTLPNGNLLICEGTSGRFFEVDENDNIVWEYVNPVNSDFVCATTNTEITGNAVFRATRYPIDFSGLPSALLEDAPLLEEIGCEDVTLSILNSDIQILKFEQSLEIQNAPLNSELHIYNLQGRVVKREILKGSSMFDTSNLTGVHIIHIVGVYDNAITTIKVTF